MLLLLSLLFPNLKIVEQHDLKWPCVWYTLVALQEYNRLRDAHNRASQPNQKEKLEENLKAQIKKLQRARNDLSTWINDKQVGVLCLYGY